ncbi:Signal transduction histidine kinase [Bhargavaea ginsengi]|uniref:Heme sensor protein HssS n=1 Tax=Bhargavaea ginsengi TaxID=426757 RepID=A0A1H6VH72_9BACL|nr:HAMP domain-containing sensor histidine kinase [Bhargavaea ginsengi]SEJ01107.1 Signal transduction histidine kinase [Bhargavaea ginsengi]
MKSLYGKFVLASVVVLASGLILSYLIVNTVYHREMKEDNDAKHVAIAASMAAFIEKNGSLDLDQYLKTHAYAGYILYVTDREGGGTFYGGPFNDRTLPPGTVGKVLSGEVYHGMRDLPAETFWAGYFANDLANTAGVPFTYDGRPHALFIRPDIGLLFSELHWLTAIMLVSMAVIGFAAVLVTAKRLIRPLTELTEATNRVAEERFTELPDIRRGDEIGQLSDSFRRMVGKLAENDLARKAFISDVSHDFQSPLQNMQGYAKLLMDPELPADRRHEYAEIIRDESARLSALSGQLLLLSSIDQFTELPEHCLFSVSRQLKETVRRSRWPFEEKGISVTLEVEEASVTGDRELLGKVWENLLSNAAKYTTEGGEVRITVNDGPDGVTVNFDDSGPGIPAGERERIFERFYRSDKARSAGGGTGLGLSIAGAVIALHGGRLTAGDSPSGGARFTVFLPEKTQG